MWYFVRLYFTELLQTEIIFWVFLLKTMCGEMMRDLKSDVSDFIKDFCFESGDRFWGMEMKKVGKGFRHILFQGKILAIMWCRRKLSVLWCLGGNWGEQGLEVKWQGKEKILKSMVAQSEKIIFLSVCYFDFVFVLYDVRQVWWDLVKNWTLFYMVCFENDCRFL